MLEMFDEYELHMRFVGRSFRAMAEKASGARKHTGAPHAARPSEPRNLLNVEAR